jgi:hypothetical protein
MKKTTRTVAILLFLTMFFVRCTRNMDYPDPVKETISRGNWKVGYFFSGQDKTSTCSAYTFSFNNDGTLDCNSTNGNFSGGWELVQKVAGPAINIQFNGTGFPLNEINNTWSVVGVNSSEVSLSNQSGSIRLQRN